MKINKIITTITSLILLLSLIFITGCSVKDDMEQEEIPYPYDDLIDSTVIGYDGYFLRGKIWTKSTKSILDNSYTIDNALTLEFTFKRDAVIESISFDMSTEVENKCSFIFTPNDRGYFIPDYAIKTNQTGYDIKPGEVKNFNLPLKLDGDKFDYSFSGLRNGADHQNFKSGDKMYLTITSALPSGNFGLWPENFKDLGMKIFNIQWNESTV